MKRLKEAMDIKNKRILQLESVVGEASDFIAGRENSNDTNTGGLQLVISRLEKIETKMANIQQAQAPSIVINTCASDHNILKQKQTSMTQTEPTCAESDDLPVADGDPQPHVDDHPGEHPLGPATSTPSL